MTQRSTRESVGELIDGRYRLLRVIGEGAMGRVYEAEHIGIGKRVALKILHRNFSNLEEVVARFRDEARLATRIGNAHIVDVTDSGVTGDGRLYFAMEYLAGVELRAEIGRGPLSFERALRIAAQIAEALSSAHQVGVIHRDLKPENVMLVERDGDPDFVKILDFGIAMTMNPPPWQPRRTQPGLTLGTPEYMAPEQALALAADARSDIYALGAILYEMVTGQQPFQADTYTEILVSKASSEPRSPRELRRDLPEEIEAAILKAMARDAGSRHQSMHALIEDITRCLEWRAVAASAATAVAPSVRPPPVRPPPVRPPPVRDGGTGIAYDETAFALPKDSSDRGVRRNRVAVAAAATVAVIGLAGTAYWYRSTRGAARDAPAASSASSPSGVRPGRTSSPHRDEVATARRKIVDGAPSSGSAAPPRAPGARTPTTKAAAAPAATRKQARALLSKAQAATKRRDFDTARRLYDRVARGRFDPELGHLGLGQVALANGDETAAVGHAKRSLRFGGGLPARRVLARALARLGQYAAAAEQYRMILQREPRDDDSRRGLKDVLRAQRKRR